MSENCIKVSIVDISQRKNRREELFLRSPKTAGEEEIERKGPPTLKKKPMMTAFSSSLFFKMLQSFREGEKE